MDMPELQQTARDSIGITMNNKEEPTSKRSSGLSSSPTPSSSHDAVSENSENALEGGALRRSRGLVCCSNGNILENLFSAIISSVLIFYKSFYVTGCRQ